MKKGGGKLKGGAFERLICSKLSLWVTNGKAGDVFWRSAMSGGRATVGKAKGKDFRRQSGDISAVAPEGHTLTNAFYIECKHVADLQLASFVLNRAGKLFNFWMKTKAEARAHNKLPMLIAKQNHFPIILLTSESHLRMTGKLDVLATVWGVCDLYLFDYVISTQFWEGSDNVDPSATSLVLEKPVLVGDGVSVGDNHDQ